jgi:hypothetical protein
VSYQDECFLVVYKAGEGHLCRRRESYELGCTRPAGQFEKALGTTLANMVEEGEMGDSESPADAVTWASSHLHISFIPVFVVPAIGGPGDPGARTGAPLTWKLVGEAVVIAALGGLARRSPLTHRIHAARPIPPEVLYSDTDSKEARELAQLAAEVWATEDSVAQQQLAAVLAPIASLGLTVAGGPGGRQWALVCLMIRCPLHPSSDKL